MHKLNEVVLVLILSSVLIVFCERPFVRETNNGPVEGIEQISSLGQIYYAFRGIPFAEPPITGVDPYTGENVDRRFKAPVPLERNWNENLKVHNFSDFCVPAIEMPDYSKTPKTSENCLFLNVYVPAGGAAKKTVLEWIYGGAFATGDASDMLYGPDFLLSEDNVIVTIQYRLGIFGFLNLGFEEYTGSMGLKDQQLALKWVYENIENFSGNKNEILLFGESAGGTSVGFQMLNEDSRKYFHRAFLSSSTACSAYALSKESHLQRMKDFSRIENDQELIDYLKTEDSKVLAKSLPYGANTVPWVPAIEDPKTVNAFITKTPQEIYSSENFPIMDALFSFNLNEILVFRPDLIGSKAPLITENVEESKVELPFVGFNMSSHPKEYKQSLEKLRQTYYPHGSDHDSIESDNFRLLSDMSFVDNILTGVIFQTTANHGTNEANHRNTYLFSCHDLDQHKLYDKHLEEKDAVYDRIKRMVKMITNFARTGDPSIENDTPFKPCISPNEIFCHEVSNGPVSSVTTNIKDQLHYETWREIEEIYYNLKETI